MTEPTIPNGDHIPSFITAAYLRQPTPSWDDIAATYDRAERYTMRRRPLPDQIRYIARQIMSMANKHNDSHLHALYVSLSLTATEAEKQLTGPPVGPELRDAVADALTLCLKATAPISNFPGAIGHYGGVTPHELAGVALDVIRPYLPAPIEQTAQRQKEAAAAGARGEEIQLLSCGHTLSLQCANCSPVERDLRVELHMAYEQLVAAITHDRQPYPTAWSYEQACKAREQHRERADRAEQEQRKAEASAEVWQANAELAVGQWDQARATIARVEAALHDLPYEHAARILAAMDETGPATADVAHLDTEQPVNGPQPVGESAGNTCQIVHVDGGPVRIHGQGQMDETSADHFAEVVRAAKRRFLAEHPEHAQPEPDSE